MEISPSHHGFQILQCSNDLDDLGFYYVLLLETSHMLLYTLHFNLRLAGLVFASCFIPSPPSVGWSLHRHLPGEPRQSHLGHHRFQPQARTSRAWSWVVGPRHGPRIGACTTKTKRNTTAFIVKCGLCCNNWQASQLGSPGTLRPRGLWRTCVRLLSYILHIHIIVYI